MTNNNHTNNNNTNDNNTNSNLTRDNSNAIHTPIAHRQQIWHKSKVKTLLRLYEHYSMAQRSHSDGTHWTREQYQHLMHSVDSSQSYTDRTPIAHKLHTNCTPQQYEHSLY